MVDHGAQRISVAVRVLMQHLPPSFDGYWLNPITLHKRVQDGGFRSLPFDAVASALLGYRSVLIPAVRKHGKVQYYRFGNYNKGRYQDPEAQATAFSRDVGLHIPRINPNHFLKSKDKAVKEAVEALVKAGFAGNVPTHASFERQESTTAASALAAPPDADQENTPPDDDDDVLQGTDADQENTPPDDDDDDVLQGTEQLRSGLKIVDINVHEDFMRQMQQHAATCHHLMEHGATKRMGFDMRTDWSCSVCGEKIIERSGRDARRLRTGRRGPAPSEINRLVSTACFENGIAPTKALKMFECSGISSPARSTWDKIRKDVFGEALKLSKEQLVEHRREHVRAAAEVPNYLGPIEFLDQKCGVVRKVHRGPIAGDGAGPTRAYNHRITGSQHGLCLISCLTDKAIYVEVHQISCVYCSRTLTKYLDITGKRVQDLLQGEINLTHDGPCYRNTNLTPAQAEEFAMEEAGERLLDLPDDEAIFADVFVSDGDTRGSLKFIQKQRDIMGPVVEGIAQQLPDFGHFIKCISNGLYTLAEKDSTLKGKSLLEPSRIRAISGDVARHIHSYHDELLLLHPDDETRRSEAQEHCMRRIASIVKHHCGEHSTCDSVCCLYLQLESVVKKDQDIGDGDESDDASAERLKQETIKRYAEQARFRGKLLSLNAAGQEKVAKVIHDRVNKTNIERVARQMSSNGCENLFGMSVVFTEGKRLNWGQTDGYTVILNYVAAKQGNRQVGDILQVKMGTDVSAIRTRAQVQREMRFKQNKLRKQSDPYKSRRNLKKVTTLNQLLKDAQAGDTHQRFKVSPTEDGRTKCSPHAKAKRTAKCVNCHQTGHNKANCPETILVKPKASKKGGSASLNYDDLFSK
jgi:hypothetical protein